MSDVSDQPSVWKQMGARIKDRWTHKGTYYELGFAIATYIPVVIIIDMLVWDTAWVRVPLYILWLYIAEWVYRNKIAPRFNLPVWRDA